MNLIGITVGQSLLDEYSEIQKSAVVCQKNSKTNSHSKPTAVEPLSAMKKSNMQSNPLYDPKRNQKLRVDSSPSKVSTNTGEMNENYINKSIIDAVYEEKFNLDEDSDVESESGESGDEENDGPTAKKSVSIEKYYSNKFNLNKYFSLFNS